MAARTASATSESGGRRSNVPFGAVNEVIGLETATGRCGGKVEEEGVGSPLPADGGVGAVPWAYDGLVRQREWNAQQGGLHLLPRSAGQIRAPDRSSKKQVAGEELFTTGEGDRARRVPRRGVHPQRQP